MFNIIIFFLVVINWIYLNVNMCRSSEEVEILLSCQQEEAVQSIMNSKCLVNFQEVFTLIASPV